MQRSFSVMSQLLAVGMLLGHLAAQQTPASNSQPASGQSSSGQAASGQSGTAAKTPSTAAKKPAPAPLVLKTDKEKQSYAMGMNLGSGLKRSGVTLDPALVARGIRDAQSGAKTALTEDEAQATLKQLQNDVRAKMEAKSHEEGAAHRKAGEDFLAANKTKPGVVTLASGLQYKILKAGDGPKPTVNDTVSCNYRGTLIDGTEFDASTKHGGPISFPVGGVIKGWTEALQLMPVGSKWQLFIPPDLAYGDHPPQGGAIGPGDTLVFEVELVSIGEQKK